VVAVKEASRLTASQHSATVAEVRTYVSRQCPRFATFRPAGPEFLSKQSNRVLIEQVRKGELLAAWFGGSWEKNPDVVIYSSRFTVRTHSLPWVLAAHFLQLQ
jgi:hypothetical protein